MLDSKIFGSGKVIFDSFGFDPAIPMGEQAESLTEDLLLVEYENGLILDVGWYPERSPDGLCRVTVEADSDWARPWFERGSTEYQEVLGFMRIGAKVAEWLGHAGENLSLRLYDEHNPEVPDPGRARVLDAMLKLDGQESTLVCLEAPDGTTLMI